MGLAIGWRLLYEGAEHVVIFEADEAVRSSAAWVAAGMLSPRAEAGFEDMDVYEEGVRSLDLYPQFLDELRSDAGDLVPRLDRSGILVLATNTDEIRELDRQYDFRKRANIPVERLSGEATREREPLLSTKVKASLWLEQEAQINNRQLCLALKAAFLKRGGVLHEHCKISEIIVANGRAVGVRFGEDEMDGQSITIAAGAWSSNDRRNYSYSGAAGKGANDRTALHASIAPEAAYTRAARVSRTEGRWPLTRRRNG